MDNTEKDLLEAARHGNRASMDELLTLHEQQIYRFGLRMCGSEDAAREVLAPIAPDLDVIENGEYHRLLLVFRGDYDAELLLGQAEAGGGQQLATIGYGIAAWRLLRGEREAAARLLAQLVAETPWPAFGHLAAEAQLARDGELRSLGGL